MLFSTHSEGRKLAKIAETQATLILFPEGAHNDLRHVGEEKMSTALTRMRDPLLVILLRTTGFEDGVAAAGQDKVDGAEGVRRGDRDPFDADIVVGRLVIPEGVTGSIGSGYGRAGSSIQGIGPISHLEEVGPAVAVGVGGITGNRIGVLPPEALKMNILETGEIPVSSRCHWGSAHIHPRHQGYSCRHRVCRGSRWCNPPP